MISENVLTHGYEIDRQDPAIQQLALWGIHTATLALNSIP